MFKFVYKSLLFSNAKINHPYKITNPKWIESLFYAAYKLTV